MITSREYQRAVDEFGRRIDTIDAGQWRNRVPCCPDWDVADLVDHVIEETRWVPLLLRGDDPDSAAQHVERSGQDRGVDAWPSAARQAREAAVETPAEADVRLPSGTVRAGDYLGEMCCDTLVHAWDLADATDGDRRLDPELVAVVDDWFDGVEEEWRAGGAIGPRAELADDADAQTRLLARFGRTA